MKTPQIFHAALVALFLTLSLGACKKEAEPEPRADVVFWTKLDLKTLKVDCYVDGQMIGTLSKASPTQPACGDASSPISKITIGKHTLEVWGSNGQIFKSDIDAQTGFCYDYQVK
jgi:hypothetical protein